MNRFIQNLILLIIPFNAFCQSWEWVKTKTITEDFCHEFGERMGRDPQKNIYVINRHWCSPQNNNQETFSLMKFDSVGNYLSQTTLGYWLWSSAINDSGYIFTTQYEAIKKFSPDGVLQWSVNLPGRNIVQLYPTKYGGVFLSGITKNTSCSDSSAYYMLKADGQIQWSRIGDVLNCTVGPVTADKYDNFYALKQTYPGNIPYSEILKIDPSGALVSSFAVPEASAIISNGMSEHSMIVDDDLNLFLTNKKSGGNLTATTTIVKYDANGLNHWTKVSTGRGTFAVRKHDNLNNLYLAVGYSDSLNLFGTILTGAIANGFAKLDTAGNIIWIKGSMGTTGSCGFGEFILDESNNILAAGNASETHQFDNFTAGSGNVYLDIILAKLNQSNVATTLSTADIQHAGVNVFPNPSSGSFTIENENMNKKLNIKILNNIGQVVFTQHFNDNNFSHEINLTQQPKGLYILKCETEKGSFTRKIVLQ